LITYYKRQNISVLLIVLAGILFGALIEVLQILMPFSRTGEWTDIGFNTIGALLAGGLLLLYKKRLYSQHQKEDADGKR
ncbi:MAG: VanZ family protein, partial [Cyclonatronaceae bacterium]